jgi:hypothetical protein
VKVYIIECITHHEATNIFGVFSTRKRAQRACKAHTEEMCGLDGVTHRFKCCADDHYISTHKVDE